MPTPAFATPIVDIRPGPLDGIEPNAPRVLINDVLYFVANDGTTGIELWRSDRTAAGTYLVKNINAVGLHSRPRHLTRVGDLLFFQADDGLNGTELWVSDGTEAGTMMVRNIVFGSGDANPVNLVDWNGTLWFTVGSSLWKSDGTFAGTQEVWSGPGSFANGIGLVPVGNTLFFSFNDSFLPSQDRNGTELWKTDGTDSGTGIVADLNPGQSSSNPFNLTPWQGQLVFGATGHDGMGFVGTEPWITDGTENGTALIKNINPGAANSLTTAPKPDFTPIGGSVYFVANDGGMGRELWVTDGTEIGTELLDDIYEGPGHSNPTDLTDANGTLFFRARGYFVPDNEPYFTQMTFFDFGYEVWTIGEQVDGGDWPNHYSRAPVQNSLLANKGEVVFSAAGDYDPANDEVYEETGTELWRSGGGQSRLIENLAEGALNSAAEPLAVNNGALFFSAEEANTGRELYFRDITPPFVSNVAVNPNPVGQNLNVTVTATADDSNRGNSRITRAEYVIDALATGDLDPVDGAFDSATEDLTAVIPGISLTPGEHSICVTAWSGNAMSNTECVDLVVEDDLPDLLVRCTHSPVWPQPGDTVTVQIDAFDGIDNSGNPRHGAPPAITVDTLEIWLDDPTMPAFTQTNAQTASFNAGMLDEGTFAYGCRLIDDASGSQEAVFSGWRRASVGTPDIFSSLRAIPLIYNRIFSEAVDIAFVADEDGYSSATDPDFLNDVADAILNGFYGHGIYLRNQPRLNLWLARDMGNADRGDVFDDCDHDVPTGWGSAYAFVDAGAILHTDCMRDCAFDRVFSVEGPLSPNVPCPSGGLPNPVLRHEAGHRPFGLADEYCCDGGYYQQDRFPNVYEEPEDCSADAPNLGRTGADCREFTEDDDWYAIDEDFSISDPASDDLMADNGTPQAADVRRMQWMFDSCVEGGCGGGPRCSPSNANPVSCSRGVQRSVGGRAKRARLPEDPTSEPIPEMNLPNVERGLALDVQFNSRTEVVAMGAQVTDTDSPMNIGNPPLLRVECLDAQGVTLDEFNAWHPLWVHDEGLDGNERLDIQDSGAGTIIAAFHPDMAEIRLTDIALDQEVLLADVSGVVQAFCAANPEEPTCATSTSPCGDPVDTGTTLLARAPSPDITATDALHILRAAVGAEVCELCVCDVDGTMDLTSTDALYVLQAAVGQDITFVCPACN